MYYTSRVLGMIIFNVKLATLQEENEKSFCDLDTEKTVGICCHITDTYKTLHLISKVFFRQIVNTIT